MMKEFSLEGRVAVVTGASRGIGQAIAGGLAEQGADLVLVSRTLKGLAATVAIVEGWGRRALPVAGDVSKGGEVAVMVQKALAEFGRIDILVNCAAISPIFKSAERVSEAEWTEIIEVNLTGTFLCCREFGEVMLAQGSGSIVNLSSLGGRVGLAKLVAYCASKGGVELMTKVLALDWASRGVRVNSIAPGYIATDLTAVLQSREDMLAPVIESTPMGRIAAPREVVGAAVYLASEAASFVTGETICVDGGWLAR